MPESLPQKPPKSHFLSSPLLNWDNEEAESSVRQVGSLGSQTVYNVCYPMKEDMTNPRMHTRNEQKAALL